ALVTHGDIFDRPKGTYDSRLTWFYERVTPPAYKHADLVVALSPHMQHRALAGGARPATVALLPNGIAPQELNLDDHVSYAHLQANDALEILFAGRLSVEKGVDVLLDAAALLKREGVRFRLKIVGEGPERAALQARVAEQGLGDCVAFIGRVPRERLGKLYQASHVVCVPSRSDPLPTVVLEAMAAGVPVVGSDAGGIPYMIEDGLTGIVCASESAQALAQALSRLAGHPEQARAMGNAGRVRALTEFSWERCGEALRVALFAACDRRKNGALA
ncbi:MAG: glycosyltransferase family 4 protein, partial [Ramlibacter sp.]|nr:glycosyltransferase family 4 protein [Ramlibacter sp.]